MARNHRKLVLEFVGMDIVIVIVIVNPLESEVNLCIPMDSKNLIMNQTCQIVVVLLEVEQVWPTRSLV